MYYKLENNLKFQVDFKLQAATWNHIEMSSWFQNDACMHVLVLILLICACVCMATHKVMNVCSMAETKLYHNTNVNLKPTWNFKLISNWHQCEITVCEFICIENIKITLNIHCFANLKTPWNFKLISSCSLQLEITLNFQVDFKIVYACIFMQCSIKMYMYTHDYIHIYEWIFNSTIKKLTI